MLLSPIGPTVIIELWTKKLLTCKYPEARGKRREEHVMQQRSRDENKQLSWSRGRTCFDLGGEDLLIRHQPRTFNASWTESCLDHVRPFDTVQNGA